MGFLVTNPFRNSPRCASQIRITGIAKQDLKNTCCPGGTASDVLLIMAAMIVNKKTAMTFSATARPGRVEAGSTANVASVFPDLPTVQQHVVQNDAGHHGLAHRDGPDPNAGVVASFGDDFSVLTLLGDGLARGQDA